MNKKKLKKYIVFVLGSFIMGVGIGLCNFADLGVDPMSVLVLGTYQRLHVSFGTMNLLISLVQLVIAYLLDKKNVTIATLLAMIFVSVGIDAFGLLHLSQALSAFPLDYFWLLGGICIYCFGIAFSQLPHCGYTSYDGVIFGLQKYTKFSYHAIRWGIDLTFLISGVLLRGTAGIGTLLILLLAGRLIEIFHEWLEKNIGGNLWL